VKNFDADQDYDDFDVWFQEMDELKFGQLMFAWLETVKAGATFTRDGFDTFKGWALDVRWPEIREARECDRLSHLADLARAA
jgi:hypothetical protein